MDKEFLEKVLACKTAEELKALLNSRRQLSDDELEDVNGGRLNTAGFTRDEFEYLCPVITKVEKTLGKDTAVAMLCEYYPNGIICDIYRKGTITDVYNHITTRMK